MQIVINDASILIDLAHLEILSVFSNLNFKLFTTDFILEELNRTQRELVDKLVISKELIVIETNEVKDYSGINDLLEQTNGLSFEDCSVWYYSKKMNCTLLTGDAKLRRHAERDNIEVRGIIFIFDEIVKQNLLTPAEAALKIDRLKQINPRLPKNELDKRIRNWERKK
jgi:predicted nucleic acid-binding protein